MKPKTRSLLEELEDISRNRDTNHIIESRANNVITSAIHLLEVISRNFTAEETAVLEKKLLIAIKNRDQAKFMSSIRRISESKKT